MTKNQVILFGNKVNLSSLKKHWLLADRYRQSLYNLKKLLHEKKKTAAFLVFTGLFFDLPLPNTVLCWCLFWLFYYCSEK